MGDSVEINLTQHRILRYVWKKGKTVRKEVSRDLGINPSTVTRNLTDLINVGIIKTFGLVSTSSTVGRKSELIGINEWWKKIIGISVERGEVTSLLVSLSGNVVRKRRDFVEVNSKNLVDLIKSAAEHFKDEGDIISIAIPGIVSDGVVSYSMALGIKDLDLRSIVEKSTGKKVFVVNDANAVSANFSNRANDLVCFLLSVPYNLSEEVGMGGGIWLGGKMHMGSHNAAGESGSGFRLVDGGGTIEDLKSGKFKSKDFSDFVDLMSEKIALLTQFLDPELVVVSGDVDLLPADVRTALLKEIKKFLLSDIEVVIDTGGGESIARGAAMALINEVMNDIESMKNFLWY